MLNNKSILLTGGTGSFGRKFVELALREYKPRKLVVFSRDELKQHEMRQVFSDQGDLPIRYFIGDVRDVERMRRAMRDIDIVIHAAALKQVPACEYNPNEAILTNVIGGQNVITAALDNGVKHVIALSTDKAVNPLNLYGATKLCAEKLFVQSNSYRGTSGTKLSCVRYGNVIGSRGSVVPLFQAQKSSGVLTVTDERMTRFWLTLDQGIRFVLSCLEQMHGGEVFIPKIPSMRVMDLAEAIAPGCKKEVVGIRPGEKLHEILISEDEARYALEFPDMFVIQPAHPWWKNDAWSGKKLAEGFEYSSNNNSQWMGVAELKKFVDSASE
ncbi:MAG: UDP-N-acetylglucosamine 4,6-dehydratase (inverting) [Spirochaetia bacterium]|nr:UDP-N-acetylglucosamine 4,6-dehydratase (inverting) [Spirochaetia bacterium]